MPIAVVFELKTKLKSSATCGAMLYKKVMLPRQMFAGTIAVRYWLHKSASHAHLGSCRRSRLAAGVDMCSSIQNMGMEDGKTWADCTEVAGQSFALCTPPQPR